LSCLGIEVADLDRYSEVGQVHSFAKLVDGLSEYMEDHWIVDLFVIRAVNFVNAGFEN